MKDIHINRYKDRSKGTNRDISIKGKKYIKDTQVDIHNVLQMIK